MIISQDSDYGTLAPLVKSVGWLLSAAAAISLGWRRRAKWEPAEEDIPLGPARVGGLIAAVLLAIIWSQLAGPEHVSLLLRIAAVSLTLCLLSLLLYGFIVSTNTYMLEESRTAGTVSTKRVIGGFSLAPPARKAISDRHLTVQELLRGAAYDVDKVWSRPSRAWAKLWFVVLYISLAVSGTVALACGGILLLLKTGDPSS
jgi:hypothetical protein